MNWKPGESIFNLCIIALPWRLYNKKSMSWEQNRRTDFPEVSVSSAQYSLGDQRQRKDLFKFAPVFLQLRMTIFVCLWSSERAPNPTFGVRGSGVCVCVSLQKQRKSKGSQLLFLFKWSVAVFNQPYFFLESAVCQVWPQAHQAPTQPSFRGLQKK